MISESWSPIDSDIAKNRNCNARLRVAMERRITRPMLYQKGWPSRMLSDDEADLLAEVRGEVSRLMHLNARYLDREAIHGRSLNCWRSRPANGGGHERRSPYSCRHDYAGS